MELCMLWNPEHHSSNFNIWRFYKRIEMDET